MSSSKEKHKTKNPLSFLISALLLILGLTAIAYLLVNNARQSQTDTVADFKAENIYLDTKAELVVNFISQNEHQEKKYNFSLHNDSDHSYQLKITGELTNAGKSLSNLEEMAAIDLPAKTTREIDLSLPLDYSAESQVLKLTLSSELKANFLVAAESLSIYQEFSLLPKLLKDPELVNLDLTASPDRITYKANASPSSLNYNFTLRNNTALGINSGYWEVSLLDANGQKVQPLELKEQILAANETKTISSKFDFVLPPANLLHPGEQTYKIKLLYKGTVSGRLFQVEKIAATNLTIKVESI